MGSVEVWRVYFDLYVPDFRKVHMSTFFALVLFMPIFSTKYMHTDFVVEEKCTIFWAQKRFEGIFNLYAPNLSKSTSWYFFFVVLFKTKCTKKSMHTDFVFHEKCNLFRLNWVYFVKFSTYKSKYTLKPLLSQTKNCEITWTTKSVCAD